MLNGLSRLCRTGLLSTITFLALPLLAAAPASASIVYSGVLNVAAPAAPPGGAGLYINFETGAISTTRPGIGNDFDLLIIGDAPTFATISGGSIFLVSLTGTFPPQASNLPLGTEVGPATVGGGLPGGTATGSATPTLGQWPFFQQSIIGFSFKTAANQTRYGWARFQVGGDMTVRTLVDYAWENSDDGFGGGNPINVGDTGSVVPPPFFAVITSPDSNWVVDATTITLTGLAVADASCGAISYQWQRNGVDLAEGPGGASPGGGYVAGVTSTTLNIYALTTSDSGVYTLVATTPSCGVRTSTAASLVVYESNLWTVSTLQPLGASRSWAYGISGPQLQSGEATFDGLARAVLVNSSAGTWINLHPVEVQANSTSSARGMAMDQIAGITTIVNPFPIGNRSVATLWTRTAGVWTWNNINPVPPAVASPATFSIANATDGVQQVGAATVGGQQVAALWSGTGNSFVSLNPAGSIQSEAKGVRNGQQVGSAFFGGAGGGQRAGVWTGTAASWVSLNPPGATTSVATGTDGTQQVGYASITSGADRASLWTGTPGSWVDLHPSGSGTSRAQAVANGQQVGIASFGGRGMAAIWTGSASSYVNLHAYLPATFIQSQAESIWSQGDSTYISGVAIDAVTELPVAVMWTKCTAAGIGTHPSPISTCTDIAISFAISASGTPPFTYQWSRNGTPIDPQANASAATATLTIPSVQVGDSGSYSCTITNACGSATSNAATLAVTQCCGRSDVAGPGQSVGPDGELTADDIIVFLNWFFAGDSRADVAGPGQSTIPDGEFTADDIIVFLNAFFAGC